jgi:hypothetical protein
MRIAKPAATGIAAMLAAGVMLAGGSPATAAGTGTGCKGPAATLSATECTAFRADKATLAKEKAAVFTKYGLKVPTRHAKAAHKAKVLPKAQRKAFKAEMAAWRDKQEDLFAKYGLTK